MTDYSLSVVLIEYPEMWSAQCLQYDIGAQGKTLVDVIYELQRSLVGHIGICKAEGKEPFECLPTAPDKYWAMWKKADAKISVDISDAEFRIPDDFRVPHPAFRVYEPNEKLAA